MGSWRRLLGADFLFAFLSAGATLSAQIPVFVPQPAVAVGAGPVSLAVGNFTGSGHTDVITVNQAAASLSVLRGLGNGFFQTLPSQATAASPRAVAQGDFNTDGRMDLAVANFAGNAVSVLLGAGNGAFMSAPSLSVSGPLAIAVADFSGDGKPDLAVAEGTSNTVAIFLGLGGGEFRLLSRLDAGSRPAAIAVADFNADGKPDLAIANAGSNNVSILLGNGNGTFRAPLNFNAGPAPVSLAVGDFNSDGKVDLAVANPTGFSASTVSLLLGVGNGAFQSPRTFTVGANATFLAAGDFNLDGKLDLAVADTGSNTVSILLGLGDGSFAAAPDVEVGNGPAWISVLDLNGDGKPDLLVADSLSKTVSVLINRSIAPGAEASIGIGSIVNAASLAPGPVAPGEMVTVFGANLGPSQFAASQPNAAGRIATTLAQTQVLFNGIPAPLLAAGPNQLNAIVPYGIASQANAQMVVSSNGQTSAPLTIPTAASAPSLFTVNASGTGQAAALNEDGSINSASNPAAQASIVVFYANGAGQTNPPGIDGLLVTSGLSAPLLPVSVTVGGEPARVLYAGAAPGLVSGVLQVNVQLPALASGPAPVILQIGSAVSQPGVVISLR